MEEYGSQDLKQKHLDTDQENKNISQKCQNIASQFASIPIKESLRNILKEAIIIPNLFPNIFDGIRRPWNNILLYGPAGSGKKYITEQCALLCGSKFHLITNQMIVNSMYNHDYIKKIFELAREQKPSVLFFDNLQFMNQQEYNEEQRRKMLTQFLVECQGVGKDMQGITIIISSNTPWELVSSLRRRTEIKIYSELPDFEIKLKMLQILIQQCSMDINQKEIECFAHQLQDGKNNLQKMQDPLVLKRDRGLKKISEGINHFNQHKNNYTEMNQGYRLAVSGIEDLIEYSKQETNKEVAKVVKAKINEFFDQAELMKTEVKALAPQPQPQQQSQVNNGGGIGSNNNNGSGNSSNGNDKSAIKDGQGSSEDDKLAKGLAEAIVTEKPNVHWDDVAGLENAKKALQEAVILPIKFPQLFDGVRQPWKGILLYGPPGTGKTFLAKACATECDATFFSISSADLISKYVGESEKLIKQLFKMAREKKPSIIFIDEVDSMTGNREGGGGNEASQRVKTQFLIEMQGVGHDDKGVLVLGATNIPWGLDPAIRRRFEKRIYIQLPEPKARTNLLQNLLSKTTSSLTSQETELLGEEMTEGFSGADMSILVRDASYEPLRKCERSTKFKRVIDNGKQKWTPCGPSDPEGQPMKLYDLTGDQLYLPPVSADDFVSVLSKMKPSVSQADIKNHIEWTQQFGQEG